MKHKRGDMWEERMSTPSPWMCVTTNSTLNMAGHLVMGAGAAKQAADRHPELPAIAGEIIRSSCGILGVYGIIMVPSLKIILFQTKTNWRLSSKLPVIQRATDMLDSLANNNKHAKYHLNYPGIGYGGLPEVVVRPIVSVLPDNVTIWRL